jgi:hypothetical protein
MSHDRDRFRGFKDHIDKVDTANKDKKYSSNIIYYSYNKIDYI